MEKLQLKTFAQLIFGRALINFKLIKGVQSKKYAKV